jgi:hypothetical protein
MSYVFSVPAAGMEEIDMYFYTCPKGHFSSRRERVSRQPLERNAKLADETFWRWGLRRRNFKPGRLPR